MIRAFTPLGQGGFTAEHSTMTKLVIRLPAAKESKVATYGHVS